MANRMISYGYGMESGKLVVIDSEAEIVRRVFREYIEGKLLQEIADELTEEGVEFYLESRLWNKNKVFRIIENEKYIGERGIPPLSVWKSIRKPIRESPLAGIRKSLWTQKSSISKRSQFVRNAANPFIEGQNGRTEKNGFVRTGVKTTSISPMWRCLEGYCRQSVWLQRNPMRCYQRKRL